jgi:hypothetical protein
MKPKPQIQPPRSTTKVARFVLFGGLLGALGGGYWLGLALAVLSGPERSFFDLANGLLATGLLTTMARQVELAAGRKALRVYALIVVACTVLAYITH